MKKIRFEDIKGFLPITVQNADISPLNFKEIKGIKAISYQCEKTSSQQFYKPISKILSF